MSQSKPAISVIMPVYNAEKWLRFSIESILNQTYIDFEFIIIDDGSTDNSKKILQSYSAADKRIVEVCNSNNIKLIASLNKGIDLAQGEYIARMDADDVSHIQRFERQMNYLKANPEIDFVSTGIQEINDNEKFGRIYKKEFLSPVENRFLLLFINTIAHGSIMCKKKVLKGNKFDHVALHCEDYDLWCRLSVKYNMVNMGEILYYHRNHTGNISKEHRNAQLKTLGKITIDNKTALLGIYDNDKVIINNINDHFLLDKTPAKLNSKEIKKCIIFFPVILERFCNRYRLGPKEKPELTNSFQLIKSIFLEKIRGHHFYRLKELFLLIFNDYNILLKPQTYKTALSILIPYSIYKKSKTLNEKVSFFRNIKKQI